MEKLELFRELIERSQTERRGLAVYVSGQMITGVVKRVVNDQAIELTSQQYHKAVVMLDSVEAMSVS